MTVREALSWAVETLKESKAPFTGTPVLDAAVLLAFAMGVSREKILASYPEEVPEGNLGSFRSFIERRCSGIPVSYIRRMKEFYGLTFYVDEGVLVPRPDTETLVEAAIEPARADGSMRRIIDVCTGSGCVAIAIKKSLPKLEISASDLSLDAERVFAINCDSILKERLPFFRTSLLEGIGGIFDMIVSNPPYLTDEAAKRMKESGWPEPELALAGGADGLDLARRLIEDAPRVLRAGGYLLMEADPWQMEPIGELLSEGGFGDGTVVKDLAGNERVISGRLSSR